MTLARISHHLTAEARNRPVITVLRLLAVLNVLFKYALIIQEQCCPGKVAPSDGKSRPLNVLWPVLPGNDLKSRGRKWSPERSIRTRHNEG